MYKVSYGNLIILTKNNNFSLREFLLRRTDLSNERLQTLLEFYNENKIPEAIILEEKKYTKCYGCKFFLTDTEDFDEMLKEYIREALKANNIKYAKELCNYFGSTVYNPVLTDY